MNSSGFKMFGSSPAMANFSSVGAGGALSPFSSTQHNMTQIGNQIVSPNSSGFGMSMSPMAPAPASSPPVNKFPAAGGPIVFTPGTPGVGGTFGNPAGVGVSQMKTSPMSPFTSYPGRSTTSYVQSPPQIFGGTGNAGQVLLSPPPYSSTMVQSPLHHNQTSSPIGHGYGSGLPQQYQNTVPYGYGTKALSPAYHVPQHYHHDVMEPMHVSPVSQHPSQNPQHHHPQYLRNPHSPPRPQYMPAFLTGVDAVGAVPTRPRRVFDRSPSTSPPTVAAGGRSPSKVQHWSTDQQAGSGSHPQEKGELIGAYSKRGQVQGRQLRFTDVSSLQQSQNQSQVPEEKEKPKRSGPPIRGFGSSEELSNFLNSPLLKENNDIVPGAAIAQEAIAKARLRSPVAESNWITVFGFPSAASSFILSNFSQFGPILQSKSNPGGNWLHIQFSSRIDARRALSCNGKVLGGTIMVGVITSPKEVIELYEKPEPVAMSRASASSAAIPTKSPGQKTPLQEKNDDNPGKSRTSGVIRPLVGSGSMSGEKPFVLVAPSPSTTPPSSSSAAGVKSSDKGQNENIPMPTTSTGYLTKAMEYMFGW